VILYRTTPWARAQMTPELLAAIDAAEPSDMLVTLGRGSGGWTCRILSPRQAGVLGESYYHGSIEVAFRSAVADMEEKQMLREALLSVEYVP
jgi:hypothetical protein